MLLEAMDHNGVEVEVDEPVMDVDTQNSQQEG